LLFAIPNVPPAGLIIQQYFRLGNDPVTNQTIEFLCLQYAPSFVFEFTAKRFINQESALEQIRFKQSQETINTDLRALKAAAEAASSFPYDGLHTTINQKGKFFNQRQAAAEAPSSFLHDGLLTTVEEKGKIFNHYNDFFAARERRQEEMMRVESPQDRKTRELRARNPAVKSAKVYIWEKTQSSGGHKLYKQVQVNKKRKEDMYSFYKPYQRLYNAFANEWDLCEDFSFGNMDGYDSNSNDGYDDQGYPEDFVSQPTCSPPSPPSAAPMDVAAQEDWFVAPMHSQDLFETLSLVYGYIPRSGADDVPSTLNWDAILRFLGFVDNLNELDIPEPKKSAMMNFFCNIVANAGVNDMDNLMGKSFKNIKGLFAFEHIQRPSEDLFVFSSPLSNACQWVLGVHYPAAALYVCRYILENPHAHTILTVAH